MGREGTLLITAKQLADVIYVGRRGMFLGHFSCSLQIKSIPLWGAQRNIGQDCAQRDKERRGEAEKEIKMVQEAHQESDTEKEEEMIGVYQ